VRLTVVGCSGSIPGPDSPASSYLLEHRGFRVVVDMGHGSLGALQRYIALHEVDAVVLSHLHPDHCIDLTAFHVAHRYGGYPFAGPVPVYGPSGTAQQVAAGYGMTSTRPLHGSFTFRELSSAASVGPFGVRAERVAHPVEAYAVRFEADGASLVYSGDTGPCRALDDLADGVDVLLAESSFVHGEDNARDLHLTGRDAGAAARDAGAGRLLITHVPPWHDREDARREASEVFDGPIDCATAGMSVEVGR
jgi:ribonuclease BN (tRNA processing enzyme)